jgi:hypothetical protein
MRVLSKISFSLLLGFSILISLHNIAVGQPDDREMFTSQLVPITSDLPYEPLQISLDSPSGTVLSLSEFLESLELTGQMQIVGVYVPGLFAVQVLQQPAQQFNYVSNLPNIVTQFKLASDYGSYGFLAHSYLAGVDFFDIEVGQSVILIDGIGMIRSYIVSDLIGFQAFSPQNPYSHFRSLGSPWKEFSAEDLFYLIYAEENRVIFQTCISLDSQPNWGRFFVIAVPYHKRYGTSVSAPIH